MAAWLRQNTLSQYHRLIGIAFFFASFIFLNPVVLKLPRTRLCELVPLPRKTEVRANWCLATTRAGPCSRHSAVSLLLRHAEPSFSIWVPRLLLWCLPAEGKFGSPNGSFCTRGKPLASMGSCLSIWPHGYRPMMDEPWGNSRWPRPLVSILHLLHARDFLRRSYPSLSNCFFDGQINFTMDSFWYS